jgi:Tfp pilus assembly protein PilO
VTRAIAATQQLVSFCDAIEVGNGMRQLTKLEKFGLAAAMIVAGTFFYIKNIYDPQEKTLKKTITKLNKVVAEVNSLKETPPLMSVRGRIEQQKGVYEKLREQTANLTVKNGTADEITELLGRINVLLDDNGLMLTKMEPKPVVPGDFFTWNVFRLSLEGTYGRLLGFLEDLRAMDDAVRIGELRMEKSDNTPLQVTFDLMI